MLDKLIFYNHWQNGDIHLSRSFVRYVMKVVPAKEYIYCHRNSPRLLLDIPGLRHDPAMLANFHQDTPYVADFQNNMVAINTWYMASPAFKDLSDCTLNVLYDLFEARLKQLFKHDISAMPLYPFVPEIDFDAYSVEKAEKKLSTYGTCKKVFISNGKVISGHSHNFLFNPIIEQLADSHKDVLFLVTNKGIEPIVHKSNVEYTADIIELPPGTNDLNENGFVSDWCDVIVGRSSGAYIYAYVQENMLDSNTTFVCFCTHEKLAKWAHYAHPADMELTHAKFVWSNDYAKSNILDTISLEVCQIKR